jgi:hypothetical protein
MKYTLSILLFFIPSIMLQGCLQCITGGNLHIKKRYVSNVCGLLNGVYVREVKVDSFYNNVPVKYATLRSASLYKQGASPNKDPKRLYFAKDCKRVFLWDKNKIVDTLYEPIKFNKNNWYLFHSTDANMEIFMFVDELGKRHFQQVEGKSGLRNF